MVVPVRGWPTMKIGAVIGLVGDLGMLFAPGDHLEPVLQGADHVEVGDFHPDCRQPCLVDQLVGDEI